MVIAVVKLREAQKLQIIFVLQVLFKLFFGKNQKEGKTKNLAV